MDGGHLARTFSLLTGSNKTNNFGPSKSKESDKVSKFVSQASQEKDCDKNIKPSSPQKKSTFLTPWRKDVMAGQVEARTST